MDKSEIQRYKTERLTKEDLNKYAKKLNKIDEELNNLQADIELAKQAYDNKQLSKEDYLKTKKLYKHQKELYRDASHVKAFKNNFENANKILKNTKPTDPQYPEVVKEQRYAKDLYAEFKIVTKSKGKYGQLEKLNQIALEVRNVNFSYENNYDAKDNTKALDNVSFTINKGEYVAIVGHNGSGKSTLSKILIGVLEPSDGTIKVFGNLMNSQNVQKIRRFLGIVFQNPDNQFIGSTVKDDIAFGLENKRVQPDKMQAIIERSAKRVGMEKFLDNEPLMLSGGQKQRVAIASTLALDPDIIIFDEATSMLDPKGKREIKEIMVDLKNEGKKTILSITHDMDEILNASKVLIMNRGKLIRYCEPIEIVNDKEFLRKIGLEMPFFGMIEDALTQNGIKIDEGALTLEQLVDNICKIKPE